MRARLMATTAFATMAGAGWAGEVTIATVNNPDMVMMQELSSVFMEQHPDITVNFAVLPDAVLRQNITQDVAVGGGRYDVVTMGPFEVQASFGPNGWLEPLTPKFEALGDEERTAYDLEDIIPTIRGALTYNDTLYALPFYGESSFTMYRKDLFEAAGLTMPQKPTWEDIRNFACALNKPDEGTFGIAMKGLPDYGQLAPFITFMHSYGAKWFDMDWQPQFTSPEFRTAFTAYTDLVRDCGAPGATSIGFNEALTLMSQGQAVDRRGMLTP